MTSPPTGAPELRKRGEAPERRQPPVSFDDLLAPLSLLVERHAVTLIYRAGLPHASAAAVLGLSPKAFAATVAEAMRTIAATVLAAGPQPPTG